MFTTYDIIVAETMPLLIAAVAAVLDTQTPIGAPFLNRQSEWCQAVGTPA